MTDLQFLEVHPVLPVRDIREAVEYYSEKLGFSKIFADEGQPGYAVLRRDGVEIHLQWHDEADFESVEKLALRFLVRDPDALFAEYSGIDVFHDRTELRNTAWGTREFAFYDRDGNGLFFYRDLNDEDR